MNFSDVFTAKSIGMYWNTHNESANVQPYFGSTLFPAVKKAGLDLKWIKGKSGLPVSLMPSAFDTVANVRNRIGLEAIQTEMPFFRDSYLLKETDRQEILRAQDAGDPYAQAVIANVYKDATNLINGANVVPERMIMQLLSPEYGVPQISISANGVNYSYNYDTAGSFKGNNWTAKYGTSAWSDHTNADPIQDISDAQDEVEEKTGVKPTIMLLSKKTMKDIVSNNKVKNYILAKASVSGGAVRVTTGLVQTYLAEELGITCVINNKKFANESGTATAFYPDDMVTLLPAQPIGNTYYGTSPEEADLISDTSAEVMVVNTGVAVATIKKAHPVNTQILASEIVLPSFEGMDMIYVINTNAQIEELTVTSVAGSTSGKTSITVAPTIETGHSYKYKSDTNVTSPAYGDTCTTGYTVWNGIADITATTDNKILIVEVDANNKAMKSGIATVTSKA